MGAGRCRRGEQEGAAIGLKLESDSAEKLKTMGVKVVEGVDKTGFIKAATPIQDQLAKEAHARQREQGRT